MITGSVLGSGSKRRWRGTRWAVAGNVAAAWVITLPCAGVVGALYAEIGRLPGGTEIIYALVVAAVAVHDRRAAACCSAAGSRSCARTRRAAAAWRPTRRRSASAARRRSRNAPPAASRRWAGSCTFRGMTRLWHGFAAMGAVDGNEFVVTRGEGARVWDSAGREYLDASAGLWFCSVGHGRAEIADAAAAQMTTLAAHHCFVDHANEPAIELADRIVELSPFADGAVFFGSGGSEAVDTACKLARRYWSAQGQDQKTMIISRAARLPRHERVRHVARRHPGQPRGLRHDDRRHAARQLGRARRTSRSCSTATTAASPRSSASR